MPVSVKVSDGQWGVGLDQGQLYISYDKKRQYDHFGLIFDHSRNAVHIIVNSFIILQIKMVIIIIDTVM